MEASPLTQQSRPETFKPKIVQLYEILFNTTEYAEPSEGFWREFFLLGPDRSQLRGILDKLSPDETLNLQLQTQQLFARATQEVASGTAPNDLHALETLTTFLGSVLNKKYTNPSSDVITVLAGLDQVDQVMTEFVAVLDTTIRSGSNFDLRLKAIKTAISMTSGAYKTSLITYFTHRDLFPSLMKFIHDSDTHIQIFEPFLLLGLLANYNRFEFQNPYHLRLVDFVNEATIQKIVKGIGVSCAALRNGYVAVQDDVPEGWSLTSTLIFFGLRALAPGARDKASPPTPEEAKEMFAALPAPEAALLLATYDFTNANKLFGYDFVSYAPEKRTEEAPFSSFLSLTSYLLQHAYRSPRVSHYAELNLFTLRIIVEDPVLAKRLCSDDGKRAVRLCRQRQPYLPVVQGERILATVIFDIMIDTITHNLRRRLDINIYSHTIAILLRLFTYLSSNKVRLAYHWSELWRTLLSLMRFLTTYASDLSSSPEINILTTSLVNLLAFSVSAGDTFLPDPASYDDLFYKLVETGPILTKFGEVYKLHAPSSSTATKSAADLPSTKDAPSNIAAIDTLLSVSSHFHSLLFMPEKNTDVKPATSGDEPATVRKRNLSPRQVHQIIKQGYDTLSIQTHEGLDAWEKWREADYKPELKRAARCAVEDARKLVV
ncbi:hypothetical protein DTO166G4_3822 [Paecilomyces variotii]|nr:hypothetical protein DTO166G4_3822 [Paecilomyces variotii]KAJ9222191.1 hypothetical protein DTO169C6_5481 [Paecilomyces variotii]KAJ9241487.1 hypothetical protein DTO166G5_1108 [Paecilomyces variotii]KAJ9264235.1 hypothetical protein DTO195F2_2395 [Paecilomyces variotii]KAJ9306912.1 hypothetical protein DTO217A2_3693 [Paecilomyces variotii]